MSHNQYPAASSPGGESAAPPPETAKPFSPESGGEGGGQPETPRSGGADGGAFPVRQLRGTTVLWIVLAAGAVLRLWLVLTPGLGFPSDRAWFLRWARTLHEHGFGGFYQQTDFCDYPPLMLIILRTVAWIVSWIDPTLGNEHLLHAFLKMPACLADLGIGALLFVAGRRLLGSPQACAAAALYVLNPITFYNSAFWGQVDALPALALLGAMLLTWRRRWLACGFTFGLALAMKLQSMALAPLLLFEALRAGRKRAVGLQASGIVLAALLVCAPFSPSGVVVEVLRRSYVDVVGQYPNLSSYAYNVWYLLGIPLMVDTSVPVPIVRMVAGSRVSLSDDASWLFDITWRVVALALYALMVAVVLSLYSRRATGLAFFAAGGLSGLAFFLFPPEMHERYVLPALAILPLWVVTSPWKERAFFLLSASLLLNHAAVLKPAGLSAVLSGVHVSLFVLLAVWLVWGRRFRIRDEPVDGSSFAADEEKSPAFEPIWIRWFRRGTLAAAVIAVGLVVWGCVLYLLPPPGDALYLSRLKPVENVQGYAVLQLDRSVSGAPIHLGNTFYLRGLGTHAPAHITYSIPDGYRFFRAVVGVDGATGTQGSMVGVVEVDGQEKLRTPLMHGGDPPTEVDVPIAGATRITLRALDGGDGNRADHLDWAIARFVRDRDEAS